MSPPTRDSVEGRAYLDLQNKARREGRPTDELMQLYALEGFLARLAAKRGWVIGDDEDYDREAEARAADADSAHSLGL